MNQTNNKINAFKKTFKIRNIKNNILKMKKNQQTKKISTPILIFIILLLTINTGFSQEDVCRYISGQTIFRCNEAMPNVVITPGQETNLTIYCCLTGDAYNNSNTYQTNINIVFNETFGRQYVVNGERITETSKTFYNASQWISKYYLPENVTGFEAFEVIITFNAPMHHSYYKENMVVKSRFDLSINIPGKMIPQLAILPNVRLPADYKPLDYKIYVYTISGAVLLLILILITFKNNKFNQKVRKFFKKSKRTEKKQEEKEEKKEQEKETKEEEKEEKKKEGEEKNE